MLSIVHRFINRVIKRLIKYLVIILEYLIIVESIIKGILYKGWMKVVNSRLGTMILRGWVIRVIRTRKY